MSRKIQLLICFALLFINLGGCKTQGNQSDIPAEQNNTPKTKENRLYSKDWSEEEVIQYYWDHKDSLAQIVDLLTPLDKIFSFTLSGDEYVCSQYGNEFDLNDYPNCQTVMDLLSDLDVVGISYYTDDSCPPAKVIKVYIRNDEITYGLIYSNIGASFPTCIYIEGEWNYFRFANT